MTPVSQRTNFDCFQCCLASILDLPYEDVPDFYEGLPNGSVVAPEVDQAIFVWLAERGLASIYIVLSARTINELIETMQSVTASRFIVSGVNYSGRVHSAIYNQHGLCFDPSTGIQGLHDPLTEELWEVLFIGKCV